MNLKHIAIIAAASVCATPVFSQSPTLKEKSLEMLYQYMPAADSANYSREFFAHNVDMSLKARDEMPWGSLVPEREFLHFVVPVRVNNEDLDNHREVFYNELKDRVKGLSMKEAILEINHWCHEKVTYQPSDGRTHSPLASVSSAIGRCGEESTFGVAALRAMGIPARQVYTPRWAHTDDNHAWVEAWADGEWYFLGACEPEPVLNLGWFNAPASRGMLMHARVFGPYFGKEEILSTADGITDINVTDHYAPVDTLDVFVRNADGQPLKNARVSFRIYNYAEFYPIATKLTDSNGHASVITGLGDLLVWASDGTSFNLKKAKVGETRTVEIELTGNGRPFESMDLDIVPPQSGAAAPYVSAQQRKDNDRRFAQEDSIRLAYVATFSQPVEGDSVADLLYRSRGNHAVLRKFLADNPGPKAVALLKSLTEKDLTDVSRPVLDDHLTSSWNGTTFEADYIMSPRILNERLTPFRGYLTKATPQKKQKDYRKNPEKFVRWTAENIDASLEWYPASVTMDPDKVWETRKTSALSRDIFFVAAARSMGIPARIDPITGKTQWADSNGKWIDARFRKEKTAKPANQHLLTLPYTSNSTVDSPLYYTHFTVSKIENGEPHLLSYPDFIPLSECFGKGERLDEGTYMIVTGQRLADGGVLSHIDFLDLTKGDVENQLVLRSDTTRIQVIGSFDAESKFLPRNMAAKQSVLSTTGRGYYILGTVRPGHEPSNHALRDIAALKDEFEATGFPMILLAESPAALEKLDKHIIEGLPSTITFGSDPEGTIANALKEGTKSSGDQPVIIIADTFNRVVFVSSGYNIGLGQKLLDTLRRIK
ncbi:MAG: transglutaminase domain-containing protein [Paramuribaculum sp.]|nr:transglutaminase domain-containing protein [Paramuribaculum sp.]